MARLSLTAERDAWVLVEGGPRPEFEYDWWQDPTPAEERLSRLLGARLIGKRADGALVGELASEWQASGRATVAFWNERGAAAALVKLEEYVAEWSKWSLSNASADGSEVLLEFSEPNPSAAAEIVTLFAADSIAPVHRIALGTDHSAGESLAHFRAGSLRAEQILSVRVLSERSAVLNIRGEKNDFFEELQEHYRSQSALNPVVTLEDTGKVYAESRLWLSLTEVSAQPVAEWLREVAAKMPSVRLLEVVKLAESELGITFTGAVENPVLEMSLLPVLMAGDGSAQVPVGGPFQVVDSSPEYLTLKGDRTRPGALAVPASVQLRYGWASEARREALAIGAVDAVSEHGGGLLHWLQIEKNEFGGTAWLRRRLEG